MSLLTAEDQYRRAETFAALHAGPDAFVIANAWDAGTAKILTALGFPALATTSAGIAHSLGHADGAITRDASLANARTLIAATQLPVAADLESGFGATPQDIAETIRLAADAGLVGGSIEDAIAGEVIPLEAALERLTAAIEAARALPFKFTVTARAENFLYNHDDLKDTITRLQAFEAAGADVLYAPGLTTEHQIRTITSEVTKPVNVLAGGARLTATVTQLGDWGVRRISLGSNLARVALSAAIGAAREIAERGTFEFAQGGVLAHGDIEGYFG
ncbi:isocitrate lyase/phosphoenolpyruvate mutase family protein [Catenulispora sp. NL8]|uniref:Isocitrate lyase/phosphoenolpyruvate mutase family protein n=2 Tax=Catenulispora pinistramenti TaxID=2705254 RepID=A0ABS5KNQ3_9ACTN|nr:isocitrate lyase/phosphoenolpyruvate mutase family protein [Catenulispora pinistramenti]MBS2547688.1 isocitrate lyase/phosphoenolpyruvate mutase family protein [Catenulispora pinistramenti]